MEDAKRGLLDTQTNRIGDIVDIGDEFEVHGDFKWIDISSDLASDQSGLKLENGVVIVAQKFLTGGSPRLKRDMDINALEVTFNDKDYQAGQSSQDALSRNILTDKEFEWIDKDNNIDIFTSAQGKELLGLMVSSTTQIIKDYHKEKKRLLDEGYSVEAVEYKEQ